MKSIGRIIIETYWFHETAIRKAVIEDQKASVRFPPHKCDRPAQEPITFQVKKLSKINPQRPGEERDVRFELEGRWEGRRVPLLKMARDVA